MTSAPLCCEVGSLCSATAPSGGITEGMVELHLTNGSSVELDAAKMTWEPATVHPKPAAIRAASDIKLTK